ncbi:MAG: alpha/beta fold hydrolase [Bacteroidota bacterium]
MRLPFRAWLLAAAILAATAAAALAGPAPLAFEERGAGSPTIVLVHNIGGDRSDWSAVAARLAARHRVLLVDLPGHGSSPAPAGDPTVRSAAASLAKTLSDRRVDHAILVGHSYGALVALQAALDQPKRVAAVVVVDAATYTPPDSERIAQADRVLRERYSVFLSAVYESMASTEAEGESLVAHAERVPQPILTAYFHDVWREDLRPRLRSLKTPVHVVATRELWPEAESWVSARKRLGYETAGPVEGHRMLDSKHMVAFEQPDSLAGIIESVALGASRR